MRRALLACVILLAPATSAAASPATPSPRTALDGFICERAPDALNRVIAVVGVIRPISGTQEMQMRFVLERRMTGSQSFTTVQGGDLGHWISPKPATLGQQPSDVWRLRKLVANLAGPATYWFRVSFRWLGAEDVVLDRVTMASSACAEPA